MANSMEISEDALSVVELTSYVFEGVFPESMSMRNFRSREIAAPQHVVHAVLEGLQSHDAEVVRRSIGVIKRCGTHSIRPILDEIENAPAPVMAHMMNVLSQLDESALPVLRESLDSAKGAKYAAITIAQVDPDAVEVLEEKLVESLSSSDQTLSRYAIDAVVAGGDHMIPLLIDMLGMSDPFAQQNATNALIDIGDLAVADLVDELDNPNPLIQQNCMRALRSIGSPAAARLRDALADGSQLKQQNAAALLKDVKAPKRVRGKDRNRTGFWKR